MMGMLRLEGRYGGSGAAELHARTGRLLREPERREVARARAAHGIRHETT